MGRHDNGARARFDEFVRAELAALTRMAYLLSGDRQHAEDLVQVSLMQVAMRWKRLDDPSAYARRVLYTRTVSWWRRRRSRVTEVLVDAPPERAGPGGEPDLSLVVRQALARLTPHQRAVLVLRFLEDRTETDTAHLLGCRPGTVKSQTRHALKRLRRLAPELADLVSGAEPGPPARTGANGASPTGEEATAR